MTRILLADVDDLTAFGRDRGSGIVLPTADLRRGDVYFHTGLGCLLVYTGATWRQVERTIVANDAARDAISTTYSALLHEGFEVWVSDVDAVSAWTGVAWRPERTAWATLPLVGGNVFASTPVASSVPGAGTSATVSYRVEGGRVRARGWAVSTNGVAANTALLSTPIPAGLRPLATAALWTPTDNPKPNSGAHWLVMGGDGQLYGQNPLPAGSYYSFDQASWPLG